MHYWNQRTESTENGCEEEVEDTKKFNAMQHVSMVGVERLCLFVFVGKAMAGVNKYDIEASKNNLMRFKIEILSRSDEKSR